MNTILAVYPRDPEDGYFEKMPPLGMLWVAGNIKRNGYDIAFIDQQVDGIDIETVVYDMRPPLVLIGGTTHSRFLSFDIARRVKSVSPSTVVVYGGPHASFTAINTLSNIPEIDIIVRGEGEETSIDLVNWVKSGGSLYQLKSIKGISYRDSNGAIITTVNRKPIEDLDRLGFPDRTLVPMHEYGMKMEYLENTPGASIITARGCPIGCTFCSASAMFGRSFRMRSYRKCVDEIEMLMEKYNVRGIKVFDSTFNLSRTHVEGFCMELKKRQIDIPWECELRVDNVDKELLAKMRESGCYYVDIGVESGVQRVLDECVKKKIKIEKVEKVLRWCKSVGILTKVFFSIGHPKETFQEAKKTNRFIRKNLKYMKMPVHHTGLKIYPGTYVEKFMIVNNLFPENFVDWSSSYSNLDQKKLFKKTDSVPILIQPGLGIKELRYLRINFILMRLMSISFIIEKLKHIFRSNSVKRYIRIIIAGLFKRVNIPFKGLMQM